MTASIIPLSTTSVDLKRLATVVKQTLDVNISSDDTLKGHISALQDVFGNDSTPLRHQFQSFIFIVAEELLYTFITSTRLDYNIIRTWKSGIMFAVVSGNLHIWKSTVFDCSHDENYDIREIATLLLGCFDKLGLTFIFNEYHRTRQKDNTLLLEYKK